MPIDPSILQQGIQPIKIEDPLTRYSNYLVMQKAMNEQDDYQRGVKERDTANTVYRNALRADGSVDETGLLQGYASQGLGYKIPDLRKSLLELKGKEADVAKTDAETQKAKIEAVMKKMDFFNNQTAGVQTFQDLASLSKRMYTDSDTAPFLTGMGGSYEKDLAEMKAAAATPASWTAYLAKRKDAANGIANTLKQHYLTLDNGNENVVLRAPEYGVGKPEEVARYKVGESPKATKITINNIPAQVETEYGKTWGNEVAKDDHGLYTAARKTAEQVRTADRVMDLLEDPKNPVITGWGADMRLGLNKFFGLGGATDAERIQNTEVLMSNLADTTLGAIKTSGLGTGQGFTDRDREFLERAKSGNITYDRQSLIRIADLNRRAAEETAKLWNDRAQRIPKSAIQGTGADTTPVTVPKRVSLTAIPQAAKDYLKTHPTLREEFEKKYGEGTAARVLGE